MERLVHEAGEALAEQLHAVHELTVALHRAETAAEFYEQAIDTIVTALGADRASLLLFDADGVMRFKSWRGLSALYRAAVEGHTPWQPDDTAARPIVVPDVEAEGELAALLPVLRAEGIAALAFVPLISGGSLLGKFMLYYDAPHPFTTSEIRLAEIVAGHVALATERQRVHGRLRSTARRLASLQEVTARLARAMTVAEVADVVLGPALAEIGGSTGSLCMISGDDLRIAAAVGYADDVLAHWDCFPLGADLPASEAVRTGRAIFLRSSAERAERYPVFRDTPVVRDEAYAIVPLGAEIPLGAFVVGFDRPRQFGVEDEEFLVAVAGQAAAALGRASLYEERERDRARWAFLADASAALGSSLDYGTTLAQLAALAVPRLADLCAIYLLEDHRMTVAAFAHADPARAEAAGRRAREQAPLLTEELLRAAAGPGPAPLPGLGAAAAVAIPLRARGRVLGALALGADAGRELDERLLELGRELADRAATAIDNARLFAARTAAARTLQASLLPPQLPAIDGLDLAATYLPGGSDADVGGDFYDLFPLYGDRHLLLLGDVCGRGVEAATVALLIRHVTRSAAVGLRAPAAILRHLNEVLLQAGAAEPEPRFCTAVVAVVHPRADGTVGVTLALAGHPQPLLRTAPGTVVPVGAVGSLLGVTPEGSFTDRSFLLEPGHVLVCYTDGATERRNGPVFYGEARLAAAIGRAGTGAGATVAAIEADVLRFAPAEPTDDMAVLAVRPSSPNTVTRPAGPAP